MRIDDALWPYLTGEKFSNGHRVRFQAESSDSQYITRQAWLCSHLAGKRVVHIGCVDHDIGQVRHKRQRGKWLHGALLEASARVLGVDIDAAGIEKLRDEFGMQDLLAADLLNDPCHEILCAQWDALLLGEVLEHIGDPVSFLRRIRERFADNTRELLITVPNGFAREIQRLASQSIEAINTDHRFWFTPYTIAKVCIDAGWRPEQLVLCRNGVIKHRSFVKNWRMQRKPLLRNNIIVRAVPMDAPRTRDTRN